MVVLHMSPCEGRRTVPPPGSLAVAVALRSSHTFSPSAMTSTTYESAVLPTVPAPITVLVSVTLAQTLATDVVELALYNTLGNDEAVGGVGLRAGWRCCARAWPMPACRACVCVLPAAPRACRVASKEL